MKKLVRLIILVLGHSLICQTSIGGIVNRYFQVSSFAPASGGTCASPATPASVTIGSAFGNPAPASLAVGMQVLIMQMQAGSAGVMDRTTGSVSYGNVSNVGKAGNYEFATIASVSGSTITFTAQLVNTYDPAGKVQLIPTWLGNTATTNYTSSSTITPLLYDAVNGVGGVVVISTAGTITLNHNIDATAMGFQGGDTIGNAYAWGSNNKYIEYACCGSKISGGGTNMDGTYGNTYAFPLVLSQTRWNSGSPCTSTTLSIIKGSRKGRGIFGIYSGEELSKGKAANGGGGAHGYNSGGGGGGGYNGGGNGGYELAWACNDNGTGTQPTGLDHGGRGGLGITGTSTALFMGGGGGAGHGDGNAQVVVALTSGGFAAGDFRGPSSGGDGGGIIILKASQLLTGGSVTLSAKGGSGGYATQDGAGGGGGGGSIILEIPSYTGTFTMDASGGEGGHAINPNNFDCHGTGGGGGSGYVLLSVGSTPGGVSIITTGGGAGRLLQKNCGSGSCNGGDEFLEVKTTNFCGANVYWGAGVGTNTSPSYSSLINTQSCVSLPAQVIHLTAEWYQENHALVKWNSMNETNFSHYEIERSLDGDFFNYIGRIQAEGSAGTKSYQLIDEHVPTGISTLYYRLKVVDKDNAYQYSAVCLLNQKGNLLSVFPNPGEGNALHVLYWCNVATETIQVILYDLPGKKVHYYQKEISKGRNEIILSDLGLSPGSYFIQVSSLYGTFVKKIVVE